VVEVFPHPETTGKVMYLVASEMNERYNRRLLRYWGRINRKLQSIRMVKYRNKALVDAFCPTQNSCHYDASLAATCAISVLPTAKQRAYSQGFLA
jgi:hypothetical protein